ncbi:MAG: helix-turn-helix transcriptional regulator [Candidatus Hodarchaeota archaeon]
MSDVDVPSVGGISTRDKILQYLLLRSSPNDLSSCTVKMIALELDLSPNAVRQHLNILEQKDLVVHLWHKESIGRPALVYKLHEDALNLFPKAYADFSLRLLDEISKQCGPEKTVSILEAVGRSIAAEVKEFIKNNLGKDVTEASERERMELLVTALTKYGKFAELIEEADSFGLKSHNCLVYDIVKDNPLICHVDEIIMGEVTGTTALKEKCIRDGHGYCLYRIQKKKKT